MTLLVSRSFSGSKLNGICAFIFLRFSIPVYSLECLMYHFADSVSKGTSGCGANIFAVSSVVRYDSRTYSLLR